MPGDGTRCTFTIRSTIFLAELQLESRATVAPARLLRFAVAKQLTAQQLRSSVSSGSSSRAWSGLSAFGARWLVSGTPPAEAEAGFGHM